MIRLFRRIFRPGGQVMRFSSIISFVAGVALLCSTAAFAQPANKLLSVQMDAAAASPTVTLQTESPVGYSYTVYDSFDPVRVVIDFPGMDVSQVQDTIKLDDPNLQEVRVSAFDLESGKLGRIEVLLGQATNYDVALSGNDFKISFNKVAGQVSTIGQKLGQSAPVAVKSEVAPVAEPVEAVVDPAPVVVAAAPAAAPAAMNSSLPAGKKVFFDGAQGDQARFTAPEMDRYQFFKLAGPPRLVVDVYGVEPGFKTRSFEVEQGFSRIRVGVYTDKTRFVFDAQDEVMPGFEVGQDGDAVVVDWSGKAMPAATASPAVKPAPAPVAPKQAPVAAAQKAAPVAVKPAQKAAQVAIESLDFDAKEGVSTFTVTMSGPGKLIAAVQDDDVVRFGVENATIGRSLRRVVDASSFPSAVKLITPYIVQNKGVQEVRFAAELKGPVSYRVTQSGNRIVFTSNDGAFAEFTPPSHETVAVIVEPTAPAAAAPSQILAETIEAVSASDPNSQTEVAVDAPTTISIAKERPKYTGETISLVFDNADIRQILQLIGDVSGLNIIASDEIKGSVTLRLIDVPWDQALDLIMDIKDLGMLRDGNVARILPRARIRSMEEAQLTARRTKERLEDLATEVIMVSHTDLGNVAGPATELLTERGKITQDSRNKQIIVTDVPSVIADIKQLISILDTPERQVLIESRIVEASSNFSRDLGVKWGFSYDNQVGGRSGDSFANLNSANLGLGGAFVLPPAGVANTAVSGIGSAFTFGRVGVDSTVLDLRISALETSGHGKVVSQPRVATLNGEAAMISQGTKIPYQSVSDEGTKTKFENAELRLEVTPIINPDGSVILEISAANSSVGATVPTGVGNAIAIDEKKAETKVLVRDGETTVIGGIFVEDERFSESGVPVLMSLPYVGKLFKSTTTTSERRELLIFITPRILD